MKNKPEALASPEVLVKAGADVKRADNRHQQSHYAYRAILLRYRSIGPDRALRSGQLGNAAQSMRPTPDGRVMATSPHDDVKKSSIPLYKTSLETFVPPTRAHEARDVYSSKRSELDDRANDPISPFMPEFFVVQSRAGRMRRRPPEHGSIADSAHGSV